MAPLPSSVTALTTADLIARGYEEESRKRGEWNSLGINISEAAHDCPRFIWYSLRWASPGEELTGQKIRRFGTGHREEARLVEDLRRAGLEVLDLDPSTGKQFRVSLLGGHLRGKLDGQALGLPELGQGQWAVVECKSHNEDSFKTLRGGIASERCPTCNYKQKGKGEKREAGIKNSHPKHYGQCQFYMRRTGLAHCLYLAVNKNTDEVYSEIVDYDAEWCDAALARIEGIIKSNRAPARISENPDAFPCNFCRHKAVCHKQEFGRINCRTCCHSTPHVGFDSEMDETSGPRWDCERFLVELATEQQARGCVDYLAHPDFVPGEQVDAGENLIVYEMPDGSVLRFAGEQGE